MPTKKIQSNFFDALGILRTWETEWKDMPEFVQENLKPAQSITIHFEDEADLKEFSELVNQSITSNTKSIWFPKPNTRKPSDYRYIDEP